MINQRLFDHYGIDTNKDLGMKVRCPRPFDTVLIDKFGSCYACECTAWLPQSIGNLQVKSLSDIIGSLTHRMLTASIDDGTYRYCNKDQCSYLRNNTVEHTQSGILVKELRLAIDDSCNLRCPSCRNSLIFHRAGSQFNTRIKLADRVNEWLSTQEHPLTVHVGSDGDPFASHSYRYFMTNTPRKDNIDYSILTNGLMFREFHTSIPHVISNLKTLGVSIDGTCKETYEKLRMGGKWDKILEGLECISDVKNKYRFTFDIHMVVQQDNHNEIEQMAGLCRRYGADRLYLNRIQNWQTGIDFHKQTFASDPEFIESIKQLEKKYHREAGEDLVVYDNVSQSNNVT